MGAVTARRSGSGSEPLLVMELMERGSLNDVLHNETVDMDADVRLNLIKDICSGMTFLHLATPPILHNDLKVCSCSSGSIRSLDVSVAIADWCGGCSWRGYFFDCLSH